MKHMKQRQLGKDGPMVGEVGFGAMSFGGIFGFTDETTSHRTLDAALDLGVTHLDTALIYGPLISENVIGHYLEKNPSARKRFSIATKGGFRINPRGISNEAAFMRECLESSLRRLRCDYIDLYYVHRRDHAVPIEDVTGTLADFVREGKIGGIGYSEISPASLQRAAAVHQIRAVQSEYSLWSRLPELGLLQLCEKLGTAFVAFSPLARGVLGNVLLDPKNFPDEFRRNMPRFSEENYPRNMEYIERFKIYANQRGLSPATLANAWVLHRGPHVIPIPGTRTAKHLAENAAASGLVLTATDMAEIENILPAGFAHGNRYSVEQQGASEMFG
jgi:aryl-alcohol dehydrogenase-like predicted oxidoreductase